MSGLLEDGASFAEWQNACAALNKVNFTVTDAEEGFDLIRFGKADQAALTGYMVRFQDVSPEMVVASLQARLNLVSEAEDGGMDLKITSPNIYAKMLTGPLTPEDFNIFPEIDYAQA